MDRVGSVAGGTLPSSAADTAPVLASRVEPPFPIERLRGRGQLFGFDASMLAFSVGEVEVLLGSLARESLADELHALTSGWPAAVALAVDAVRHATEDEHDRVLARLRRPGGPLFAYLAEEAFAREPAPVRNLLRRVAPFERFSIGLCGALGIEQCADMLSQLSARSLFVQEEPGSEGWFRLHALVREFALATWPLGADELREVNRCASDWFAAEGDAEAALRSAAAAGDSEVVAVCSSSTAASFSRPARSSRSWR